MSFAGLSLETATRRMGFLGVVVEMRVRMEVRLAVRVEARVGEMGREGVVMVGLGYGEVVSVVIGVLVM